MIQDRRAVLPLAGIFLSLIALLLVPVVVGIQTRQYRERLLDQVPIVAATESFRAAVADEMAATRILVVTGDSGAATLIGEASGERRSALAQLRQYSSRLGTGAASNLNALFESAQLLDEPISTDPAVPADTALVRARYETVDGAAGDFRSAVESDMQAATEAIEQLERYGFLLTAFLAFLAFTSAMVTARLEGQIRAFARESERARREQQILLQSSGEGVFGIDANGRCTFMNPAGALLIGYDESEVLGRDLRALVLRGDTSPTNDGFPRWFAFAGGMLGEPEEALIRRKDGEVREVECITSPMIEGRDIKGAVLTVRDISQRKAVERERLELLRTEQALRERAEMEERRAKFLARASAHFAGSLDIDTTVNSLGNLVVPEIADSCIIYLVDDKSVIQRLQPVHINPERQRILAEQLERHPPRIDTIIPPVRKALLTGEATLLHSVTSDQLKAVPGDVTHESVASTVGLQSLIVVPLRARGRVMGAISYGVADSGRLYGPEDLALAEDLASRAALAIDNSRLYQQSQEALQARNEVLGIVSHDLRNPLNAVRFGAQALLRHWPPVGDGQIERNQLGAITKAADRMHRLIRDLLDVAQIDAGKLAVEPAPVPAAILLDDAIELTAASAAEKSITLKLERMTDLPVLNVDGERILQVLSNLLNNAIKFSPPGSEVTLEVERENGKAIFCVRDQGQGIDPEHIPHIFDRFWKSRNGSGGAGLGLAIVRGIVESHGGRVWVQSAPGRGSSFYFSVPIKEEDA